MCKHSLLVCLDIIHHIAKAPVVPDLDSFLANFAEMNLMQALWRDSNTAICVTLLYLCITCKTVGQSFGKA